MGYQPIERLLPKTNFSIYKLVRLAADRSVQLAEGHKKLIEAPSEEKLTTIALEEIRQGKVVLKAAADQLAPPETEEPSEEDSAAVVS